MKSLRSLIRLNSKQVSLAEQILLSSAHDSPMCRKIMKENMVTLGEKNLLLVPGNRKLLFLQQVCKHAFVALERCSEKLSGKLSRCRPLSSFCFKTRSRHVAYKRQYIGNLRLTVAFVLHGQRYEILFIISPPTSTEAVVHTSSPLPVTQHHKKAFN